MKRNLEQEREEIRKWVNLARNNPIARSIIAKKLKEILTDVTDEDKREFLLEQLQVLKGERR